MENFSEKLDRYAELAVKVGINVQPGQRLVVMAPISTADFVRKVAKKAYEAGAKDVLVEWSDEELTLVKYMGAPDEAFKEYPLWKAKGFEEMAKEGAAFLSISASNPDLLKDVDPEKVAISNKTASKALESWRRYTQTGKVSWSILSIPTKEWAAKVFPDLSEAERVEKLWDNIFKVTRVDTKDPVSAWKDHIDELKEKLDYFNSKVFKKLHFKGEGTDLTIELPEKHLWVGGGLTTENGVYFIPNMPTEEVFSMPLKTGVNGKVKSTKPLNYRGNVIENFSLTFKEGRIVDFSAEKGYETLAKLIETDEGSHYIGEVALVPHKSPVSNSGIIFYNTLFDENASCHLAIGAAYPLCIEGGSKMDKDELERSGANTSLTHVDFMIGAADTDIDGVTADGEVVAIFRNGNWAS